MRTGVVAALGAFAVVATGLAARAQVVVDNDGQSFPTPGQITVRLNGRFRAYVFVADYGAARTTNFGVPGTNLTTATGAPFGATAATGGTLAQGSNRLANYGVENYARLYPGFDAVAANGLKYGASLEIRQDNTFGAGSTGGVDGSVTGNDRTRGLLYFRREYGYIGTDRFGTVRIGATDPPTSLYTTGTFETFDSGGLNGDVPVLLPVTVGIDTPFNDVGNMYSTNKVVYLSPQFYGVDFGLSYEPSTAGIGNDNGAGCGGPGPFGNALTTTSGPGTASPGCDALASTSTADVARRTNLVEALVRYRGTMGPFGLAATASYDHSGRVHDSGITGSTTNPKHGRLEDLSYFDFGLVVTYGGLAVGGNFEVGRYAVAASGGAGNLLNRGQPNSNGLIMGATYTIGPVIFGADYLRSFTEGDRQTATNTNQTTGAVTGATVPGGQRLEQGVAAGGTYSISPGVALYLSYVWNHRRQNGFNFLTNASNNPYNNKTNASVTAIGTSFAW